MKKNFKLSVDRIEEGFAICQDLHTEDMISLSVELLPNDIKEGDILVKKDDGSFFVNKEETSKRRNKIVDLQDRIFRKTKR